MSCHLPRMLYTQFLVALPLLVAVTSAQADGKAFCGAFLSVMERDFQDIHGKTSADELSQLQLIRECAQRSQFCVVGEGGPGTGYKLIEATSISDRVFSESKAVVVSAVAVLDSKPHGRVCALTRFSGGSASAWMVSAWYADSNKKTVMVNTDRVNIRGEGYAPDGILKALSKSLYSLR